MRKYVILFVLLFDTIVVSQALSLDRSDTLHEPSIITDSEKASSIQKRHAYAYGGEDCDIVFPDKTKPCITKSKPTFSAKGKGRNCTEGVCADAKDYPYEQIEKIKHKLAGYLNFFGNLDGTKILTTKFGEIESVSLCTAMVHTIYPKTLKNEKDIEKFIINVEGRKQGLLLETCKEKATCMFSDLFPNTYTSQCTQRYATRRLLAINDDGNEAMDSFTVPSCCVCTVKQIKN